MKQGIKRRFKHTVSKVTCIGHSGTYAHEKDTVLGILRTELGHSSVQARLTDRVESGDLKPQLWNDLEGSMATGDGNNLLDLTLENQGCEQIEQVNVTDDIDFETLV